MAAALLGVLYVLPATLLGLLLLSVLATTGYALYRNLRDIRSPRWHEAARRVERDSTLAHRPLTERDDRLLIGAGHPLAEELWRAHILRLLSGIDRLRVALPSPGLPAKDPYALRYGVLLLLIAGLLASGADWRHRLAFAFAPVAGQSGTNAQLDAWIDPPAYTGEAPLYLQHGSTQSIAVPTGSVLALRVHAADVLPTLAIHPRPAGRSGEFRGKSGEYGASARLSENTDVGVREAGRLIGNWHVRVIPDNPPVIAFAEPPSRTERNAVKFAFTAGDDYGVVSARALIRPAHATNSHTVLVVDLPLSSSGKTVSESVFRDLTGEPMAGLDVLITLEARDGAGQTGLSSPVRFQLPARVFTNPLARALIEQRQALAIAEPHAKERVTHVLDALSIAPEHFYAGHMETWLALRTAYWSLRTAKHADEISHVEDLLWQMAVALEDGGALSAAQQLREMQQLLSQALAQGAPQSVIDALLNRYRMALQRYLDAMAQNAPQSNTPLPPNAKVLKTEDIEALLKAIQQMAQTGSRDKAAQMLALLQSLLENLHMSQGGQGQAGQGQPSPGSKALSDAIQGLSDLMGKQRGLLDKSFRQNQGAGDPKDGGGKGLSDQQGKLREDLDRITKGLGAQKLPQPGALGEAGREMGNAQNQLGSNAFDSAGEAEKNALEQMRQASSLLTQELMKRNGQLRQGEDGNDDPMGRRAGTKGGIAGGNVKIPDQSELARARSILEELRRRASEQGRPKEELDYIDRLLKEF